MSTARERAAANATEIASMFVLGLGFLALFTGLSPIPFWVIWIVGFSVVVPLVAILAGDEDVEDDWMDEWYDWFDWSGRHEHRRERREGRAERDERNESTTDALATLRERYARGELTDEQFEHKLDALLETEQPESAAEWRTRERERARRERERT